MKNYYKTLILILFVCVFASCNTNTQNSNQETIIDGKDMASADTVITEITNEAPKTKEEVYAEIAMEILDEAQEIAEAKRREDSIKIAGRDEMWVYQIGLPKNSEDQFWESYANIRSKTTVMPFKESKDSYYIIKNKNFSKKESEDSLDVIVDKLRSKGIREKVKIVNLMKFCSANKAIEEDEIKVTRKQKIKCYVCD